MENLLQECRDVSIYMDDIIVTRKATEENLQNLESVPSIIRVSSVMSVFFFMNCVFKP